MAVLSVLEDIANGRIQRERVFRDFYDFFGSQGLVHPDFFFLTHLYRFLRAQSFSKKSRQALAHESPVIAGVGRASRGGSLLWSGQLE